MRTMVGFLLGTVATETFAQTNTAAFASVPTLDDLGLVAVIVMVGVVGGWIVRRRK